MADVYFSYEMTERAARVFLAARGEGNFSFNAKSGAGVHPAVGDEMEFPGVTGNVVFTVIKRRYRMQADTDVLTILWLDAEDGAASPAPL